MYSGFLLFVDKQKTFDDVIILEFGNVVFCI